MNSNKSSNSTMNSLILLGGSGKMGKGILELLSTPPWNNRFHSQATTVNSQTQAASFISPEKSVVIDFSKVEATLQWAPVWARNKTPVLVCTTGFKREDFESLKTTLKDCAWSFIPNTSLGVYAFIKCLVGLVKFFPDIKSIEIHEVHHVHKKDSPSGTALLIKAALMNAGFKPEILIKSGREGEVVGIHSVILNRENDRFILTHEAHNRKLFAEGALQLAEKLASKAPRSEPYSFDELLNA